MDPLLTVAAVTMVGVGIIAGFIAYYDYTEIQPKATVQYEYIQTLNCEQAFSFPTETPLYSKENRLLLSEKVDSCTEARQLAAQKEKERLDALLADPNSYESLSREYKKLKESLEESQKRYLLLTNETSILQKEITEHKTRIDEIREKITAPDEGIAAVNVDILPGAASPEQEEYLSPQTIKVVIGFNNTIRWNNLDSTPHTLSPDQSYDGFSESIGLLGPGEIAVRTFGVPGVFDYHGEPHPWITGTVIVTESE